MSMNSSSSAAGARQRLRMVANLMDLCLFTSFRPWAPGAQYVVGVVFVVIAALSAACSAKSDDAVAPEKRGPAVDWNEGVTLALPTSQKLRLDPIARAKADKPAVGTTSTVHLLRGTVALKGAAIDRELVRREVVKALRTRLSSTFTNVFFESAATDDEIHLTAKVNEYRVAEFQITLRNDNVLTVHGAVSSSPDTEWDAAAAGALFAADPPRDHASPLRLTDRSGELLI